jgi:hypothetical protein
MSRCGRTAQLEAVALGEASPQQAHELRSHAKHCALCRHELNWLESESSMFRQRAGRDEVAELWKGVAARRGLATPQRAWPRVLVAMAAAAVLMVLVGRSTPSNVSFATDGGEEQLESPMLASPALMFFEDSAPCSKLPSGVGFQCSPVVPASFLASR